MKNFESYEELLESIGMNKKDQYAKVMLNNYLSCEGSCEGGEDKEPNVIYVLEYQGVNFEVGVTHEEIAEDEYKYTYWIS